MSAQEPPIVGRAAALLIAFALILSVGAATYLYILRQTPILPSASAPADLNHAPDALVEEVPRRLHVLLAVLIGSVLLILAFIMGAYLMIRAGRSLTQRPVGGQPTPYVDAWSQYRLDDADVALPGDDADRPAGEDEGDPPSSPNRPDQPAA